MSYRRRNTDIESIGQILRRTHPDLLGFKKTSRLDVRWTNHRSYRCTETWAKL